MSNTRTPDEQLSELMGFFSDKPLDYVMFNFPWRTEPAIQMVKLQEPYKSRFHSEYGPDLWACEFLDELGADIRKRGFDGRHAVAPLKYTTSSGHGIGKSTMVAWIIKFIGDCYPWSMGVVTANTGDQLRTKTWAELAKWNAMSKTSHLWSYSNARGNMNIHRIGEKDTEAKWRCDAMTARAENSEAFQGLHAANSVPYYIFDEASGIENAIWESRIGGATDGMPMSFDFGNPTRKTGYFFENTVGANKHRFTVRKIDSRTVAITNKELMEEWRLDWGEESDLFKVKVRGEFPSSSSVQFIGSDLVFDAMHRPALATNVDPLVIGVDVARFGINDTVIYPRIGNDARSFPFKRFNGLDAVQVAEKVIEVLQEFQRLGRKCNGLFIDGGGLGAGPIDILRRLGYNPIDVNFGGKPGDMKYRYKGDEMWGRMRDSIGSGLALPNDRELESQLTQREYGLTASGGRINLETKKLMTERLGNKHGVSPDVADALALTYSQVVALDVMTPQEVSAMGNKDLAALFSNAAKTTNWDYDPLEAKW